MLTLEPRRRMRLLAVVLVPCIAGCGSASDQPAQDLDALADQLDQQTVVEEAEDEHAALAEAAKVARAEADRLAEEAPSAVSPKDMQRGKKMTHSGPISTPLRAGIVAEQKLNIIQWQQALQLYTAMNNLDPPETHEEFMEMVIEANGIELEPLTEPYEYWYNAEVVDLQKRVKPSAIEAATQAAEQAEAALAAAAKP